MLDQALNLRDRTRLRGRRHHRGVITFASLSLIATPGCGLSDAPSRSEASVEIIQGRDSAGAIIELQKQGGHLTRARVTDLVLGTGEAEIISGNDGYVEFTIRFPGGVAIAYRGQHADPQAVEDVMVSGTWHQHPSGIFGADSGTWQAPSPPGDKP